MDTEYKFIDTEYEHMDTKYKYMDTEYENGFQGRMKCSALYWQALDTMSGHLSRTYTVKLPSLSSPSQLPGLPLPLT